MGHNAYDIARACDVVVGGGKWADTEQSKLCWERPEDLAVHKVSVRLSISTLPESPTVHAWRESEAHHRLHGCASRHCVLFRTLPRPGVAVAVPARFFEIKRHSNRPCLGQHRFPCNGGACPEIAIVVMPRWIAVTFRQYLHPIHGDATQLFARGSHVVSQNLSHHRVGHPFADQNCPCDNLFISL